MSNGKASLGKIKSMVLQLSTFVSKALFEPDQFCLYKAPPHKTMYELIPKL